MSKKMRPSKKSRLDKKLKEYRHVLKDDEDGDYAYILQLLKYKLERTRKCIVANEIITSNEIVGRQIKQVEGLLGRVLADQYNDELFKDFHKKYGRLKLRSGKGKPGSRSVPVILYYAKETPANREQAKREASKLYKRADKMRVNDLNRAFDLMKKSIWRWWD